MPDPNAKDLLGFSHIEIDESKWYPVETELGLNLPLDYKQIVQELGARHWNDFFCILDPFARNPHVNLLRKKDVILDGERITRGQFPELYPYPLYPEAGGLLPWAITDNGDTFFWITAWAPASWPTVLKGPRDPDFEVRFSPCHILAHQVAAGTVRSTVLPEDL